ncbi:MAG: HAMP domain-containing protein [Scytonematopsis contorta HA4267-MV1]|jgi:signal transduction histidine kinase|nr:HAMP domain-containing protein [Scytonematopsis contorta HA4267-MV1]
MLSPSRLFAKVVRKLPLQNVLVASVVLQIVAVVSFVGYLSWQNGQKAVNDLSIQLQSQISSHIYLQLENYLQLPHRLNQTNANVIEQGLLKPSNLRGLESFFLKQMEEFELVPYTAWGSEKGEYIGIERLVDGRLRIEVVEPPSKPKYHTYEVNEQGNRGKLVQTTQFYDPRLRPWYKEAIKKGKPNWSSIYVWFNQAEIAIDATLPVYDQQKNQLGVLDTPFKLSRISDYLRQLKISKSGQSFIIERSGILVASSSDIKPFILKKDNKPQRIKASNSQNTLIKSTANFLYKHFDNLNKINRPLHLEFYNNNQRLLLQVLPFQDNYGIDWLIVVVVPEADFMEQINANNQITIILCIVALLVAVFTGVMTARWVIKPILHLNASAKFIARGEWDKTVKIERYDELGELGQSFNSMATQLETSFSEMQNLNIELKQLNQSLEQRVSERTAELKAANQELEAFSYSVSHDLRSPLRSINAFSQILLNRYSDKLDVSGKDYLQRLCTNATRMGQLIDDLLAFSRVTRSELNRTQVDLSRIAREISENLHSSQPERQVEWIITPGIVANGDASLLRIVLENLLNNAWKFTSNQTNSRIEFNVILQEDGKRAYFVMDNGAGFDMAYVNKLFQAFQRLHSNAEFPGNGIGLAIVQRIICRHLGQVWAEGTVFGGAVFYFTVN